MGLAVLTSSFMALVMTVVTQRQLGVLKRRRSTPCPAWVLVSSRALAATFSSVVACAVMTAVVALGAYGLRPRVRAALVAALLAVVAGSLCFASVAFLVASTFVSSPEAAQPLLQLVMLPLQLISGIYFPASQLPGWLQVDRGRVPARAPDERAAARVAAQRAARSRGATSGSCSSGASPRAGSPRAVQVAPEDLAP